MRKYSLFAVIFALAIIPCVLTKSVVLAILCVVASMSMLMICEYIGANSEE